MCLLLIATFAVVFATRTSNINERYERNDEVVHVNDDTLFRVPSKKNSSSRVTAGMPLTGFDKRFEDLRHVLKENGCLNNEADFNRRVGVYVPPSAGNVSITTTRVQYIHVPKTGGTTIQVQLREWIRNSGMHGRVRMLTVNGGGERCPPNVGGYSVLAGHRGFGFCKGLVDSTTPPLTFVVLRSPLPRMISLFDYNRETRETARAMKVFGNRSMSSLIKKYASTVNKTEYGESLIRYSATQQTRFLCGFDCFEGNSKLPAIGEEAMLARAMRNLERAEIVGITERLNDVIPQLKHQGLAWIDVRSRNRFSSKMNKISLNKKSELDAEAEAILTKWAKLDVEVYEAAKKIARRKTDEARRCLAGFDRIPFVMRNKSENVDGEGETTRNSE